MKDPFSMPRETWLNRLTLLLYVPVYFLFIFLCGVSIIASAVILFVAGCTIGILEYVITGRNTFLAASGMLWNLIFP